MCTNETLKKHIRKYAEISDQIKKLEELKKAESVFILQEMETRNDNELDGIRIIMERLREDATKAGKEKLKDLFREDIDKYISVSYSRFVDTRNCKKFM